MYEEELEDSWLYQRIMNKGLEQGLEKGLTQGFKTGREAGQRETLRGTLLGFLQACYPMLVDLAHKQINGTSDVWTLQQIVNKVFSLQTAGEIEEYLLSLHDNVAKN